MLPKRLPQPIMSHVIRLLTYGPARPQGVCPLRRAEANFEWVRTTEDDAERNSADVYGRFSIMASKYVSGTGCGNRSCPDPNTTYFSQVSCSSPIGPFA